MTGDPLANIWPSMNSLLEIETAKLLQRANILPIDQLRAAIRSLINSKEAGASC